MSAGSRSVDLVRRDAAVFFHQEGSSPCLSALRAVDGPWLEDVDGKRYFDLHGNTAHHLGHAHPRLIAALRDQLLELPFCPRRYTNDVAVELAEKLVSLWPGGRAKVLLATGGSDAMEIALRLAMVSTGRRGVLSLEGSYHGHGFGALGLSSAGVDPGLAMLAPDRHHVTPYWKTESGGGERMVDDIKRIFSTAGDRIAALVAEPIRSSCHVPPDWLWPDIRALCTHHGVKLIFDEIPSGLGKTGAFFAFSHFGVVPDAVVLGKSLGGGVVPIAAVIADATMDVAPQLNLGHYTHEKNPLTARAALTTIQIIEQDRLAERAAELGRYAASAFAARAAIHPRIRGFRGRGLLGAIEIGGSTERMGMAEVLAACRRHGISTVAKPGNALAFSPPLTILEADIDWLIDRLALALNDAP